MTFSFLLFLPTFLFYFVLVKFKWYSPSAAQICPENSEITLQTLSEENCSFSRILLCDKTLLLPLSPTVRLVWILSLMHQLNTTYSAGECVICLFLFRIFEEIFPFSGHLIVTLISNQTSNGDSCWLSTFVVLVYETDLSLFSQIRCRTVIHFVLK